MGIASDLRQSVLQAAMQGKLTTQKAEDGDARELLRAIREEKERFVKEKKGKKEKPLTPITDEEIPFDIPDNWMWVRLGHLISIKSGEGLTQKAMIPGEIPVYGGNGITGYHNKSFIHKRTIVIGRVGFYCGSVHITEQEAWVTDNAFVTTYPENYLDMNFLAYVLRFMNLGKITNATAQPVISGKSIYPRLFPLPPLPEQRRIVARVEALLKEIDELEQTEKELEAIKAAFPADMKASLLQAAMEGKLTEQKAEDGDARDLLRAIREEKEKLVKEKKIKKEKPLPPIAEDEIPFDIPENWVWCRLGDLVFNHGQKKPDKTFSYIDVGTLDNVNHKLNSKENILEGKNAPSRARKIVKEGDVLYSTVRPYLHNICVIDRSFSHEPIASTAFAVMSCLDGLCNRYLYWSLLSPYFDAYANDPANSKGVAYPAINDTTFYNAIIPLPPLPEQRRIVEKLDQLLPLCDSLSEH